MIVQIYEIQTPEEAERCIDMGVNHIGSVILDEDEWRQPVLRETIGVSERAGLKNSIIPLFRTLDKIYGVLDYYRPDFLHLCDILTDSYGGEVDIHAVFQLQSRIKEKFPQVKIIRSIPIPMNGINPGFPSLRIAEKLEPVSDLFLTDTWLGNEPVKGFIGITGKRCDWKMARGLVLQSKIPVILAGGLSPDNVYEALVSILPAGADSCTHTNKVDQDGNPIRFKKDYDRVKRFVEEVRRAEKAKKV